MSIKDMWDRNVGVLKMVFSRSTPEPIIVQEEDQGKGIVMRQDPPAQRGLKRNAIIALSAGIGVVAVTMIVSGILSSGKPTNKQVDISEGSAKNAQSPASQIPSKYSDLAKYNQQTNVKPGQNQPGQPGQPGQQQGQMNNAALNAPPQSYNPPQIQDSGYRGGGGDSWYPTNNQPQNLNSPFQQQEPKNDYIASMIRFAFGNDSVANANAASTSNNNNNNNGGMTTYQHAQPNTLFAGTVIPATLITGINSDTAGDIVAQVRQNVYDSQTGQTLLIPQGSRLIGTYSNDGGISTGQNRLNAVFTRIIFPNGNSIALENQKGTDSSGYPGLSDQVDNHSPSLYRAAFLTSALTAVAASASNGSGSDNRSVGQEAVSTGIGNLLNMSSKIIDKQLNVQPTITIRPGTQFSVFINKDLVLQTY